jgi:uncharacterized protein (DUF1810 family)
MSDDPFRLSRFTEAQAPVIEQVRRELREGCKRSHWMWYIFPQLSGLGRSPTARHYGLGSLAEARAYLLDPILGPRLIECTELVNKVQGRSAYEIFGSPDDMKFHSCVTLFSKADPTAAVFPQALVRYFGGEADKATIELLQ